MCGNGPSAFYEKRICISRFRSSGKEMGVVGAEEVTRVLSELS